MPTDTAVTAARSLGAPKGLARCATHRKEAHVSGAPYSRESVRSDAVTFVPSASLAST